MKRIILVTLTLFFLTFGRPTSAATFSITTPAAGACYTPGQVVTVKWGQTSAPASNHYAVTYNTNGATPVSYNSNPAVWVLGHDFGGISTTQRNWTIPNISSSSVRVWVEGHKNNHDQTEIVSSGSFSIKSNCSTSKPPSSPPPSTKPPSPPPTTPTKPPVTVAPDTPVTATTSSQTDESTTEKDDRKSSNSAEKAKDTSTQEETSKLPKWAGMVYLSLVVVLIMAFGVYLILRFKILNFVKNIVNKKSQREPIPEEKVSKNEPQKVKNEVKENPKVGESKTELTVEDLEKLRDKEDIE